VRWKSAPHGEGAAACHARFLFHDVGRAMCGRLLQMFAISVKRRCVATTNGASSAFNSRDHRVLERHLANSEREIDDHIAAHSGFEANLLPLQSLLCCIA
jgi:hypothetical protein